MQQSTKQFNTINIGDRFRNRSGVIYEVRDYRPVTEGEVSLNDEFVLKRNTNGNEIRMVRDDLEELLIGWERLVPIPDTGGR